jgi:hypothetical protein
MGLSGSETHHTDTTSAVAAGLVMPAKAGTQRRHHRQTLGSRLRGNDSLKKR